MNNLSLDIDNVTRGPVRTLLTYLTQTEEMKRNAAKLGQMVRDYEMLFIALERLDVEARFDFNIGSIDIRFAGDGDKLHEVWRELRSAGLEPDDRPKKGDTGFSTFWRAQGNKPAKIFMSFSSTLCRRVQVGTEMKEVPVYETVCGDIPALEILT